MRTILEEIVPGRLPRYRHSGWHERFGWLIQGTTGRSAKGGKEKGRAGASSVDSFDLGSFGPGDPERIRSRWALLQKTTGVERSVLAKQVHGSRVVFHREGGDGGEDLADPGAEGPPTRVGEADGHATTRPGLLLAVTVADCVPVTILAPGQRAVALAHAGWRGVVAGVVEDAAATLADGCGAAISDLLVHAGPAICGRCYEVGPEVHSALGLEAPSAPMPVDLRSEIHRRAVAFGVPTENVTVSEHCTLCGPGDFFSHRGGDEERQVGFVAIAAERRE